MSTPQGSGSNPPPGNPAEQPTEQASWGQPPPGGWGQQAASAPGGAPDEDADRTQRVDPRVWSEQVAAAQAGQQPQNQQPQNQQPQNQQPQNQQPQKTPPGAQPQSAQQGWAGAQQPQQPQPGAWGNQPGQQGWPGQQQPYGGPQGQQPSPYAPPQQQGWGGQPAPTQQHWGGQAPGQQPTQQWGGQQQPWNQGQPGYGQAPDAGRPPAGKRSKLPFILGGVIALLIAAAAVVLFWVPGILAPKVFDEKAVADGVTTVLTRDYGLQNVTGVTCPANTSVKAGATFTCDATIDGDASKIEIKILDAQGKYEVGRPAA